MDGIYQIIGLRQESPFGIAPPFWFALNKGFPVSYSNDVETG